MSGAALEKPPSRFSPARVGAVVLRHWYLQRRSWPRLLELAYWPTVNIVIWGFLQAYLTQYSGFFAQAAGLFLGAILLWETALRSQMGVAISFLEEVYSRNLGHLLVSPLSLTEFIAALATMSVLRMLISMAVPLIVAIAWFGFSPGGEWFGFALFLANLLLFGWSIGFTVSGLILRHGLGAEAFAWGAMFLFVPLCGVYYPVSVLPAWAQWISLGVPPSYIFDGMRKLASGGGFDGWLALKAFALNLVWLGVGLAAFVWFYGRARDEGRLLHTGE